VGYFNAGGTATGGDVNRTGGRGVFIPYFCADSCIDYSTTTVAPTSIASASGGAGNLTIRGCTCWQCQNSGYDYSFGGTRYNCNCMIADYCAQCRCNCCCGGCWCVNATCICLHTYHNVFGALCVGPGSGNGLQWWNCCICGTMRDSTTLGVSNPSVAYGGGGGGPAPAVQPKYLFNGVAGRNCCGFLGRDSNVTAADANTGMNFDVLPAGIGSSAGRSEGNGVDGASEQQLTLATNQLQGTSAYTPGTCWGTQSLICCISFSQDNFSFVFGSGISQWPWAGLCNAGIGTALTTEGNRNQCISLSFYKDRSLYQPQNSAVLDLSLLKSAAGTNIGSVLYGHGAGIDAAGPGGGGNRLNTAGGNGLVVVIY